MTLDTTTMRNMLRNKASAKHSSRARMALGRVLTAGGYVLAFALAGSTGAILALAAFYQPWEIGL